MTVEVNVKSQWAVAPSGLGAHPRALDRLLGGELAMRSSYARVIEPILEGLSDSSTLEDLLGEEEDE